MMEELISTRMNKNPNQYNDFQNYINGLREIVDTGLAEADRADELKELIDNGTESISIEEINNDESLPRSFDRESIQDWFDSDPKNNPYAALEIITKAFKKAVKETNIINKIDEDKRESFKGIINCLEENVPAIRFVKNSDLIWRSDIFARLFKKIVLHMINNRPIVDDVLINKLIKRKLNVSPKWTIVHQELQTLPNKKLEALIENTECSREKKIRLYNSIVSGDFDCFSNTIDSCEREAKILIIYAYELDFYNNRFLNIIDELRSTYPNGILACSNDDLDLIQDSFLVESPFRSNSSRTVGGDYLVYQREQLVYTWSKMVEALEMIKQGVYSSEKRILDKVINRMNQYPEFNEVYGESETAQDGLSGANIQGEDGTPQKDKDEASHNEQTPHRSASDSREGKKGESTDSTPCYLYLHNRNYIDFNKLVKLLTEPDELNNSSVFVSLAEGSGLNAVECLSYFFNHTADYLSFKLNWNGRNKVSLKLLIRLVKHFSRPQSILEKEEKQEGYVELTPENVVELKTKTGDGISELVCKEESKAEFWPRVARVFTRANSIYVATARTNKPETTEANLEEMRTIARIFFACLKKE